MGEAEHPKPILRTWRGLLWNRAFCKNMVLAYCYDTVGLSSCSPLLVGGQHGSGAGTCKVGCAWSHWHFRRSISCRKATQGTERAPGEGSTARKWPIGQGQWVSQDTPWGSGSCFIWIRSPSPPQKQPPHCPRLVCCPYALRCRADFQEPTRAGGTASPSRHLQSTCCQKHQLLKSRDTLTEGPLFRNVNPGIP